MSRAARVLLFVAACATWSLVALAAPRDDEEPDLPANVPSPLYCPGAPAVAPPGEPIVLRCVSQPSVDVARVLLFFRAPGAEDFTTRPTIRTPAGWWKAIVPATAVTGSQVQYFLEARDPADEVVATVGRRDSPNLVLLKSGAPQPVRGIEAMRSSDAVEVAPPENPLAGKRPLTQERRPPRLWLAMGAGLGYGFAGTRTLEWAKDLVAPSGGHPAGPWLLQPEVGVYLRPSFALAVALRGEIVTREGGDPDRDGAPARGAHSLLVRALYLSGDGPLRFSLGGIVGGGEGVRLVVKPDEAIGNRHTDTIKGGPLLAGFGFGFRAAVAGPVGVALDLRALLAFPDAVAALDAVVSAVYDL